MSYHRTPHNQTALTLNPKTLSSGCRITGRLITKPTYPYTLKPKVPDNHECRGDPGTLGLGGQVTIGGPVGTQSPPKRTRNPSIFQHFNFSTFQHFNFSTFQLFNFSYYQCWTRHLYFKGKVEKLKKLKSWKSRNVEKLKSWNNLERESYLISSFQLSTFQHFQHFQLSTFQHFNIFNISTFNFSTFQHVIFEVWIRIL